jgi:hypothetical protein
MIYMKKGDSQEGITPSLLITNQIAELADWRGNILARLRKLILETAPDITEEWKWGTAVWSQKGLVCSSAAFKDHVKLNFFKGASLEDPQGLFNAGLDAMAARSIDFSEGDELDVPSLKDLIRAAITYNISGGKKK